MSSGVLTGGMISLVVEKGNGTLVVVVKGRGDEGNKKALLVFRLGSCEGRARAIQSQGHTGPQEPAPRVTVNVLTTTYACLIPSF